MGFAEQLHTARIASGLTQSQLARRAKTSQSRLASYEKGRVTPTAATQERLLKCARHPPALVLDDRRAEVVAAAKRHGLSNVRVFGSVARNEDTLASDIDLLVTVGSRTSLVEIVGFGQDAESITGYKVDVVTDTNLDPESEIMQEALYL